MKIAFVGKGGSGKSSVSWLAVKTLEDMGSSVLAVDADHNMDLTSNLGLDPEQTPLMHASSKDFMKEVGLDEDKRWSRIVTEKDWKLPTFRLSPPDTYTSSISTPLSSNLSLINVGLGSPDVLFSDKCAHGLSGPLKYYLGLLDEEKSWVVIDSVAGADMVNYGLYAGIDAVIGVVEPHRNSVKVFEQIHEICRKTHIPCYVVINKPSENEFYTSFLEKFQEKVIGEIPFDSNIMTYNFAAVSDATKAAMTKIVEKVSGFKKRGNLQSMQTFQEIKGS